jgi:hemoglobin-like flavoprotein
MIFVMTTKQIGLIKSSWSLVAAIDPQTVGSLFYNRLFEIAPEVRPLFNRTSVSEQSKKLLAMLSYVISKLDKLEDIIEEVVKLAQRHASYGVKEEHYTVVGGALLWTLEKGLGAQWNEELKEAWTVCYVTLSSAMINASEYVKQNAA